MDLGEVLDLWIQKTRQALEEAQAKSAEASRQGRYAEVQKAAERIARLASALEHLEGLRGQRDVLADVLAEVGVGRPPAPRRGRGKTKPQPLPKGLRTPQGAYCLPILQALEELGGRGRTYQVVDRVGELMREVLNEVDYETLPSGGNTRWRNTVHWCRWAMVRDGLLASGSPSGIWEITEKGRQYLREHGGMK